ncbi:DNA polymerase III subunit epsilon [Oceanibaculum sp.]|uniref:DNA polymerase III subunit epsilon n=1 Tax=Oceanibaculum sp. TaxID=1903597 RepID=UPI00258A03A5|nr:DNA polymerase III subunit epsilon [Oceanibaculum sp.]MCH2393526.1 DNA polymerase III subunit epsilon [Oceanibaculum sp.]
MREIALDTETTGLDPKAGHRIVEIACVELDNFLPTGRTYQQYINPERDMPEEAFKVHGLSADFLAGYPVFSVIAQDFLDFIGDARLVIHNAEFDMRFLNAELTQLGHPALPKDRAVDTLAIARRKFPGAQSSLDALCRRFGIDNSHRDLHGALVDADLLAAVYLELIGGREPGLLLAGTGEEKQVADTVLVVPPGAEQKRPVRAHAPIPAELEAHARMLEKLKNPIWLKEG